MGHDPLQAAISLANAPSCGQELNGFNTLVDSRSHVVGKMQTTVLELATDPKQQVYKDLVELLDEKMVALLLEMPRIASLKTDGNTWGFQPTCIQDAPMMIPAESLDKLMGMLRSSKVIGASGGAISAKEIEKLNKTAIAKGYASAPGLYLGQFSLATTQNGPCHLFQAWTLTKSDPEFQWELSQVDFLLWYGATGQLDKAVVHAHSIDRFILLTDIPRPEWIAVYDFTTMHLCNIRLRPTEDGPDATTLELQLWEE